RALTPASAAIHVPSMAEIRANLIPPGGGCLVYLSSRDRGHVFAFDANPATCLETQKAHELEAHCARFWMLVAAHDDSLEREELGMKLAEELIPVAMRSRVSRWTSVNVVGLDFLGYVPFEALPWKSGEWDRLGLAMSVT